MLVSVVAVAGACSGAASGNGVDASGGAGSVPSGGAAGAGGSASVSGPVAVAPAGCDTPPEPSPLVGFASVAGQGVATTTGGEGGVTTAVSTLADLTAAVSGTTLRIVVLRGNVEGTVSIGSNKTLVGVCGATFRGHLGLDGSVNVIVRNLAVIGFDCTDSPTDCSAGADAITVQHGAHHLWFDHDDVSDGSDGNLDVTHGADLVTISWTKFSYSGLRTDPAGASGGHQFSNLVGHSDGNAAEDQGHLRITFHHDWWADHVVERMPRVRFGQVHLFDDLYTAAGDDYCIGVGVGARILSQNDVFLGVKEPIKSYASDGSGVIVSTGAVYTGTSGSMSDLGTPPAFSPPYAFSVDPTTGLEAAIRAAAGPR